MGHYTRPHIFWIKLFLSKVFEDEELKYKFLFRVLKCLTHSRARFPQNGSLCPFSCKRVLIFFFFFNLFSKIWFVEPRLCFLNLRSFLANLNVFFSFLSTFTPKWSQSPFLWKMMTNRENKAASWNNKLDIEVWWYIKQGRDSLKRIQN